MNPVIRAMAVAWRYHANQFRSSANGAQIPYYAHLVDVADILNTVGAGNAYGEKIFVVTFLHDVIEDTGYLESELAKEFGAEIAEYVDLLTLPRDARHEPKKMQHQIEIMRSRSTPNLVRAVKIADKTSNVSDLVTNPPQWRPESIKKYIKSASNVVDAALEASENCPITARLYKRFQVRCANAWDYWNAQGGA